MWKTSLTRVALQSKFMDNSSPIATLLSYRREMEIKIRLWQDVKVDKVRSRVNKEKAESSELYQVGMRSGSALPSGPLSHLNSDLPCIVFEGSEVKTV